MTIVQFVNRFNLILSFPATLFFNFYYLPFSQAVRIPIILYRPTFWGLSGKVIIKANKIHFAMIQLGRWHSPLLNKKGFSYQNSGGTLIFRGKADIGVGSVLRIGKNAVLDIGNNVGNTIGLNIDCRYYIKIDETCRIGWETIIMDSSMHLIKNMDGTFTGRGYNRIHIGKNNWISSRNMVLSGTVTPDYCITGACSLLNKDYSELPSYCLIAGNPAKLKKTGIWRDFSDCSIHYQSPNIEIE